DGVLNRRGTKERCGYFLGVDRELSERLLKFLRQTDIKIVLSSTWRTDPHMHPHLHEAGIHWIDVTPDSGGILSRGEEIECWFGEHEGEWDRYAIIDDCTMPDHMASDHQLDRFVKTETDIGLTAEHIEQLAQLFPRLEVQESTKPTALGSTYSAANNAPT